MKECKSRRKIFLEYLPLGLTFIGILACAIIFKQSFIKTLPVCFSLVIILLNSRANRIGFLLGALNSCIYIIGFLMEGVYGSVASTAVGIVFAVIAYFSWKKEAYGKAAVFRAFIGRQRIILSFVLAVAWGISSFVLWRMDGTAVLVDGLVFVFGLIIPILNIKAYIESALLNIVNCAMQAVMWAQIIITNGNLATLTYLIYSIYCTYMVVRTFLRWLSLYKEQQALNNKKDKAEVEKSPGKI